MKVSLLLKLIWELNKYSTTAAAAMSSSENVIQIHSWKAQWGIEIQGSASQITWEGQWGDRKQVVNCDCCSSIRVPKPLKLKEQRIFQLNQ